MISVTDEAKELFDTVEIPEGSVLRLDLVSENEVGVVFGEPQDDDQVVEHEGGDEVLHIAGPVSDALDGSAIDRVDTEEGAGFSITPPGESPDSQQ